VAVDGNLSARAPCRAAEGTPGARPPWLVVRGTRRSKDTAAQACARAAWGGGRKHHTTPHGGTPTAGRGRHRAS
jgi:hypothetical protein